jgi:hypothetical protein
LPGQEAATKRLLVISSPDAFGDANTPPSLTDDPEGPLGTVRAMLDVGAWSDGLDLVVVSDSYGLVEPLNESVPSAPVPFSRPENPDWWAGFVARNLDNMVEKRGYSAAFVLPIPPHEEAIRLAHTLKQIDAVWAGDESAEAAVHAMLAWVAHPAQVAAAMSAPAGQEAPAPPAKGKGRGTSGRKRASSKKAQAPAHTNGHTNGHAEAVDPNTLVEIDGVLAMPLAAGLPYGEAAPEPEPPVLEDLPPEFARVIEDSLYSSRFVLAVSKLDGEDMSQLRRTVDAEWVRRHERKRERRPVGNLVERKARFPWSDRPAVTLYVRLLESIGMPGVLGSINKAVAQLALIEPGRYRDIIARMPRDDNEFMADFLYLLWEAGSRMDKDEIDILRTYMSGDAPHEDLRRVGISRNLWLEDRYEVLRVVLGCFTGMAPGGPVSDYRRVWLWLDEAENLLGYREHDRWEMGKALQTLLGMMPPFVTVWFNISPTSAVAAADVQAVLENNLVITDDLTAAP